MTSKTVFAKKLFSDISNHKRFVIYGTGYVANLLLEVLDERHAPEYCIVSNKDNLKETISGIPIFEYAEKKEEILSDNLLVIVAVTEIYQNEIVSLLRNDNIKNFLNALNYVASPLSDRLFWKTYEKQDIKWIKQKVKAWIRENEEIITEKSILGYGDIRRFRIIMVVENYAPRVTKIAETLIKQGEDFFLLFNAKYAESGKISNDIIGRGNYAFYSSGEELMYYLLQNNNSIIHIFSSSFNPYISHIVVKNQAYLGKVIYEAYDIANGFYTNIDDERLAIEKYCLANASGVCYREFSLEYQENIMNLKIQKKRIRFWDYCSDEYLIPDAKSDDKELTICFSGGVITEEEYADCPFGGFLGIADWCDENKCHFHVYPSVWNEKRYEKYIKRSEMDPYFHFHKTIPYEQLIKEISQYDFGITPTSDSIWDKDICGYNTRNKYVYAATNKYFDYLDAGLPIISAIPQKFVQYLESEGVLINWTNGQYDYDYMINHRYVMRKNVLELKKRLRISNHIDELLKFYEEL